MSTTSIQRILQSSRIPARLSSNEVAIRLGFQPHDIPILVHAKLLDAR